MYTQLDRSRQERVDGPVQLNEMRGAFLLHCLSHRDVRDACCSWGDPAWRLWLDLMPLAPPSHVPTVACLIGIHAYQHGDGAMAIVAAQHALTTDPTYSFGELIIELTQTAITGRGQDRDQNDDGGRSRRSAPQRPAEQAVPAVINSRRRSVSGRTLNGVEQASARIPLPVLANRVRLLCPRAALRRQLVVNLAVAERLGAR